jgi:taurine transport system substrate-binding protein
MILSRRHFGRLAAAALAVTLASGAEAADKKVVVGYQTDAQPSALAIANGDFAKATGTPIDFRKFNSGAEIFAAIASGDVQIGYVGSSPFAAATSRGLDVKAFYINDASGPSEALVVRNGSGINSLADLKGKKLAAAPVSTAHYQFLALIKSLGLSEKDVQVFAIPQPEIVAAYQRGDLDGGFVWDPALTELKKNGKVLVTSKDVADRGAPTFGAWVVTAAFEKENPQFVKAFAGVLDKYIASYVKDPAAWGPDSQNAKQIAGLLGGKPEDHAAALKDVVFVPVKAQASEAWLGGGDKSGVAKILKDTAAFLKEQKKISDVLPSYGAFVIADYVTPLTN